MSGPRNFAITIVAVMLNTVMFYVNMMLLDGPKWLIALNFAMVCLGIWTIVSMIHYRRKAARQAIIEAFE